MCEQRDRRAVCVATDEASIAVGHSGPETGDNSAIGIAMKLGIQLAFDERNAAGGIRGRQLVLEARDDGYQPDLAEAAARELVDVQVAPTQLPSCPSTSQIYVADSLPVSTTALTRGPGAVLALLGDVGTPTMLRAAPVAIETQTMFFGAFSGAQTLLRDGSPGAVCARYLFNVRASYAQEAEATVAYFQHQGVTGYKNLISFDQADAFGQNAYDGLVAAATAAFGPATSGSSSIAPIFRVRYLRNDEASVPDQVNKTEAYLAQLLTDQTGPITVGIMMSDSYGVGADFIEALRTWQFASDDQQRPPLSKSSRLKLRFSNVSFVGANALADRLALAGVVPHSDSVHFTDDVVVSQVVPNYQSDTGAAASAYRQRIAEAGATPSFTSLEGYIAARVFIAGLERHQGPFIASAMLDAFETVPDLGLDIGPTTGFSRTNHQYASSVWGTAVQPDGSFRNIYFWTAGAAIQFFDDNQ